MNPDALSGGFTDAPVQSAHAFRAALDAMARPGRIVTLAGAAPPAPMSQAAGVLLLTLADSTTPIHLASSHDLPGVRDWITFHTNAPLVTPGQASFVLGSWSALQPLHRFAIGTPEYPDRSATLIIEMPALDATGAQLTGPGIKDKAMLSLPDNAAFAANHALYPLGQDFFLTCGARLAALPRSTQVERH
ncbi:MAG: phosphonate C-P lyase system protein PhnH [Paracoccaceae bacterium]|nr:phosphonate C-P lyase system protein PhnH [Paracoccaceae bacterium]